MPEIVPIGGENVTFTAPGCTDLPARRGRLPSGAPYITSRWKLNTAELAALAANGGHLYVTVVGDRPQPIVLHVDDPLHLDSASPVAPAARRMAELLREVGFPEDWRVRVSPQRGEDGSLIASHLKVRFERSDGEAFELHADLNVELQSVLERARDLIESNNWGEDDDERPE